MSNFLVLLRTAVCLAKKVAVCAVSLRETPALFCSLLTGRETEPAHPPRTPFSPSSPYKHNLLCCYFSRIRVFKPQGDLPSAPSSRTRGWEENQKAGTRLKNYLGLNYYFPLETRWLVRHCVSRPVRSAAAAPGRVDQEYYGRVRKNMILWGFISTYVDQLLEEALLSA